MEFAAIQTKPAYAGFRIHTLPLVRAGGLCFCSSEFYSPGRFLNLYYFSFQAVWSIGSILKVQRKYKESQSWTKSTLNQNSFCYDL